MYYQNGTCCAADIACLRHASVTGSELVADNTFIFLYFILISAVYQKTEKSPKTHVARFEPTPPS
jgi:hypothetical protein